MKVKHLETTADKTILLREAMHPKNIFFSFLISSEKIAIGSRKSSKFHCSFDKKNPL